MDVSLKEYVESLMSGHKELHEASLAIWDDHRREHAAEARAREKASESLGDRLNAMNEFRGQLKDQQATFITRDMYDQRLGAADDRINKLENTQAMQMGATQRTLWIVGIMLTMVVVVVNVGIKLIYG